MSERDPLNHETLQRALEAKALRERKSRKIELSIRSLTENVSTYSGAVDALKKILMVVRQNTTDTIDVPRHLEEKESFFTGSANGVYSFDLPTEKGVGHFELYAYDSYDIFEIHARPLDDKFSRALLSDTSGGRLDV